MSKSKHGNYEFTNEGLSGARVGALSGSIQESLLKDKFPLATTVSFENLSQITTALLDGEVAVIFEGLNSLKEFMNQNTGYGPGNERPVFPSYPGFENINTSMIRAIVSKDPKYDGLLERINEAIFGFQESGFTKENHDKWVK